MAKITLPSREYLLKRLRYEPETGKLHWLPRTPDMVRCGNTTSEANCSTWNRRNAGKEALVSNTAGYRTGRIDDAGVRAHRVIWKMVTGEEPEVIDHINGDRADNRWANLRSGTHADNRKNSARHGRNTSGATGVTWARHAKLWRALISIGGKRKHLGYFKDFHEACEARENAKRRLGFSERHGNV